MENFLKFTTVFPKYINKNEQGPEKLDSPRGKTFVREKR